MTAPCAAQHYRSPRPTTCGCGRPAAFWTRPAGDCQICDRPQAIWHPDGDGPAHTGWCVGCRNHAVAPKEAA